MTWPKPYRIEIVGPTVQERKYIQILERYGVEAVFASSEEKQRRAQAERKIHGIIFVRPNGRHATGWVIRKRARKQGIPMEYAHRSGNRGIEEALLRLLARLEIEESAS